MVERVDLRDIEAQGKARDTMKYVKRASFIVGTAAFTYYVFMTIAAIKILFFM